MSKYAQDFILEKYKSLEKENSHKFTSVVVRLEPQSAIMLKKLAKVFEFPISTSLTDIIADNIFDMVVSLDNKKIVELNEKFKKSYGHGNDVMSRLKDKGILEKTTSSGFYQGK